MKKGLISIIVISVFLVDQLIKLGIKMTMEVGQTIPIIKSFFNLTYVLNNGGAWSILKGNLFFLIIISALAFGFLIYYMLNFEPKKIEIITLSLLSGGILGNLFDRIFVGGVIDYLDFVIFKYDFPVFNFADMCIVVAILIIICLIIKEEYDGKANNR